MKTIIASIQPKWCELIASGKKTIEVRKTAPKETPFKVYMYCTKAKDRKKYTDEFDVPMETRKWMGNGKVIGEFACDYVLEVDCDSVAPFDKESKDYIDVETCLTRDEVFAYTNGRCCYGWHISDLVIYDEPKELSEFRTPWVKPRKDSTCTVSHIISRPPQSWMYCEETAK